MLSNLWNDSNGGVITTELVLVSSVLTATLLTGLGSFRSHIESEFHEIGQSLHQATSIHRSPPVTQSVNSQRSAVSSEIPGTIFAGDLDVFLTD